MTKVMLTVMAALATAGLFAVIFGAYSQASDLHKAFNPCPAGYHFKAGFCLAARSR